MKYQEVITTEQLNYFTHQTKLFTLNQIIACITELKKESQYKDEEIYHVYDKQIRMNVVSKYIELIKSLNSQITLESNWRTYNKQLNTILGKEPKIIESGQKCCYELLYSTAYIEQCNALTMNKEQSILIACTNSNLQLWDFSNEGSLAIQQSLGESQFNCIGFSSYRNWFAAGTKNKSIQIWEQRNEKQNWELVQILEGHCDKINQIIQIILNQDEDHMISCSNDRKIKIWAEQLIANRWECKQTLTDPQDLVFFLSFNSNFQYFASSGQDELRIWQQGKDRRWKQKQVINSPTNHHYRTAGFIDDKELIAVSTYQDRCFRIVIQGDKQFKIKSQLMLNSSKDPNELLFPILTSNAKNVIIFMSGKNHLYILSKQQNGEFTVLQELQGNYSSGFLTRDGNYLMLTEEKIIQVWKVK